MSNENATSLPMSDAVKQILEISTTEANRLGSEIPTPPHVLYGLAASQDSCMRKAKVEFGFCPLLVHLSLKKYRMLIAGNNPDQGVGKTLKTADAIARLAETDEIYSPALFISVLKSGGFVDLIMMDLGFQWNDEKRKWVKDPNSKMKY